VTGRRSSAHPAVAAVDASPSIAAEFRSSTVLLTVARPGHQADPPPLYPEALSVITRYPASVFLHSHRSRSARIGTLQAMAHRVLATSRWSASAGALQADARGLTELHEGIGQMTSVAGRAAEPDAIPSPGLS